MVAALCRGTQSCWDPIVQGEEGRKGGKRERKKRKKISIVVNRKI
jgi:hypothetical protein